MNNKVIAITLENSIDKKTDIVFPRHLLPAHFFSKKVNVYSLKKDITIDGSFFSAGSMLLMSDNKLIGISANNDVAIGANILKKNSIFYFCENKLQCAKIYEKTKLGELWFSGKQEIYFYDNKTIRSGVLAVDAIVNKIPLKAGCHYSFFENGSPCEGVFGGPTKVHDMFFKEGEMFEFYSPESLRSVFLEGNKDLNGIVFSKNYHLFFHENHQIWTGTIAEPLNIYGIDIPADSELYFDEEGILVRVEIEDFTVEHDGRKKEICFGGIDIKGIKIVSSSTMQLWNALPKDISLKGYLFPKGSYLDFYDGYLHNISTKTPVTNGRKNANGKSFFFFNEEGKMTSN